MAEVIAFNRSERDTPLEEVVSNLLADFKAGRVHGAALIWRRTAKTDEEAVVSDVYIENYWVARSLHEIVGLLENFKLEIIKKNSITA